MDDIAGFRDDSHMINTTLSSAAPKDEISSLGRCAVDLMALPGFGGVLGLGCSCYFMLKCFRDIGEDLRIVIPVPFLMQVRDKQEQSKPPFAGPKGAALLQPPYRYLVPLSFLAHARMLLAWDRLPSALEYSSSISSMSRSSTWAVDSSRPAISWGSNAGSTSSSIDVSLLARAVVSSSSRSWGRAIESAEDARRRVAKMLVNCILVALVQRLRACQMLSFWSVMIVGVVEIVGGACWKISVLLLLI